MGKLMEFVQGFGTQFIYFSSLEKQNFGML